MSLIIKMILGILVIVSVGEGLYILSLRRNIRKIAESFSEKLSTDTNTAISVSIADPAVRQLAYRINQELIALRKERLKLQNGDRDLKNAVTGIAHDLRTPLTAIYGYLELLEEEPMDEKVSAYLDIIRERTETLKNLTEEMFHYSVITSTVDDLTLEELSLNKELEIALAGAYGMLTGKGITPEISFPEKEIRAVLDHQAIQRVFSNILNNASKYSEGNLKVVLTETGEIFFQNRAPKLSEVEVHRLFDRFFTVENAKESTGLGLSIARLLMEKMGGSIDAEWNAGTITIILRLDRKVTRA